eukprot:gnl/Chilomastix_cuspidata/7320.p3 GENE.gnl/Chilomastix_cuspidata/7320~~gnl/Chilomastix_cuspidata/7320.p3  ORF type:complete len:181 (+),score=15.35 gnl/Chilomastix_cuspidata/7320:309-851(+)
MREAAALLCMELAPLGCHSALTSEDAALATRLVRAGLADTQGAAGEAHLALDRVLAAWPLDMVYAGEASEIHTNVSTHTRKRFAEHMRAAHTACVRVALVMALQPHGLNAETEAAARTAAEITQIEPLRVDVPKKVTDLAALDNYDQPVPSSPVCGVLCIGGDSRFRSSMRCTCRRGVQL